MAEATETSWSTDEIRKKLDCISKADWISITKSSYNRCSGTTFQAADLLQEAFVLLLDGTRSWPKKIDTPRIIDQTMRSISSNDRKKTNLQKEVLQNPVHQELISTPTTLLTVEERMSSEDYATKLLAEVLALFKDDDIAQILFEGRIEGLNAKELKELTGLDNVEYNSKLKKIRRKINSKYQNRSSS